MLRRLLAKPFIWRAERKRQAAKARYASRKAAGDTRGQHEALTSLRLATTAALRAEVGS